MINFKQITRVALGALVLGFCGAPSCTALPASETMIVLQTDLSLPKDVDRLTIQVLVRGDQRHFNEFTKLGSEDTLKIPASIGLTLDEGTDLSTPVTFRVTAFQGQKARVLREVVTTIPKDRLVALKLPIQWLCWEDLAVDPDTHLAISNCPANETCIAGTCTDNKVDPSALDDYAADEVFGGGTGKDGDGSCFDASTCFTGGVDAAATMDGGDCVITAEADKNVAIRVDSAGICGKDGCFVPLDAKSELGWQVGSKAGTLKLPKAVCDRLTHVPPQASGVSVFGTSAACPLKTSALPTCGPWSSSGKAPPDPATLAPVTLIANQAGAVSLQVAGNTLFWTNAGTFDAADGTVKSIPIAGGSATLIQSQQAFPNDLVVDRDAQGNARAVIWADNGTMMTSGTVAGRDLLGAKDLAFTIPSAQAPNGLNLVGTNLFVTDFTAGAVYEVDAKTNTAVTLASAATSTRQNNPYRIVADTTTAYWTNEVQKGKTVNKILGGAIMSCALGDPLPITIASDEDLPRNLVLGLERDATDTATKIYWANYVDGGDVVMAERSGTAWTRTVLAKTQAQPYGITVDDKFVYWTNHLDGTVKKIPTAGGTELTIAAGQDLPGAIVVDANNIYWINEGASGTKHSAIMKISKSAPTL